MSVIGRWWIVTDPVHGTLAVEDTESEAQLEASERGCGDVIEVVPADRLRRAVSLLDDLADVLADVRAGVVPADGSVVRGVLKRATRHVNGGQ